MSTQSTLKRITNTTEEGISINPSISGDGKVVAFESTEDIAGAGGSESFRSIKSNVSLEPATFMQMAVARAPAPAISQDGRISPLLPATIRSGQTTTPTPKSFFTPPLDCPTETSRLRFPTMAAS